MKELLPNVYQATKTEIRLVGPLKISGAMFVIKAGEEVVLIDPFALPESEAEELEALGKPSLSLITNTWHVRDAEFYRKRYGAKILANREVVPKIGIAVDDVFGDNETLPGGLTTISMPGMLPGETIFRREQEKGTLFVGDAIFNSNPRYRSECGVSNVQWLSFRWFLGFPEGLGTMPKLGMTDRKLADESYQRLLNYGFDQILVSHGHPILSGAKEMLQIALEKQ